MALYALVFPGNVIDKYENVTPEWVAAHVPKASTGAVWKAVIDAAPVSTVTGSNTHIITETIITFQATTVTRTPTTRDQLATEFNLTGPEWFTLVKGLPQAQKDALRLAVTNAMNASAPSDGLTDAQFRDAKRQKKAAAYLSNEETDKVYTDVITALGVLGFTLTGPQTTNFQARWQEVGRI
jgi:predicted phage gp36 major capsid-like protein